MVVGEENIQFYGKSSKKKDVKEKNKMWVNMKRMKGWKNSDVDEKSGKSIHQAGSDDEYIHILCHADYQSKRKTLFRHSANSFLFLYFLFVFFFSHRLLLFNNFYQHNAFFCCDIDFFIKFLFSNGFNFLSMS